jgi:hypothetical protein
MSLKKGIMVGVVMTVLVCLLCAPFGAWAEETDKPTGTEITVDLIIARPIGIMSLVAGTAIFVVSYPIAVLTGSGKNTADALVAQPYEFTFVRGLGEY